MTIFQLDPTATPVNAQLSDITPIRIRSTENHNEPIFVVNEAYLSALYSGEFIYGLSDYFRYERESRHTLESVSYYLPSFTIERYVEYGKVIAAFIRGTGWCARLLIRRASIEIDYGVNNLERGRHIKERFCECLKMPELPDTLVPYEIWSDDSYPSQQKFENVDWSDIAQNYPESTRRVLESLLTLKAPESSSSAKAIVLHGPPGTGKTWAIRALLTTYKSWGVGAVVLDPEVLLANAGYLVRMIEVPTTKSVRILVIEDADEILEKNGTRGSGLARLLNALDGLLGATSNTMFIFSTNAAPASLDSAITRPGRCIATVGFGPLSAGEATKRLGVHGPAHGPMTLAQIFEKSGSTLKLSNDVDLPTGQYL